MAGGRPSALTDKVMEQAYKLALLGLTDKAMADIWGVCEATITNWKQDCPEFLASLKKGKEEADAKVAQALYHRAMGYKHPAVKIFCQNGEVTEVPYVEHYPPDTTAGIFWLKNRQTKQWRDKQEVEATNTNINLNKNVSELSDDELDAEVKRALGGEK